MVEILIIFLGFLGFSSIVKDKFKIEIYFIPFAYFSVLTSMVYLSALLGNMKITSYLFHILFTLILIYYLIRKREVFSYFRAYWIFFIMSLVIVFYLKGVEFLHYDDFSHRGLISRFLLTNDRLNLEADKVISFTSYPQASAYFIYGLTRPLDFSENACLIAHALALLAGYFPIFTKTKDNKCLLPVLMIFSVYIMMDNVQINSLLVDSLISSSSFALLAFAVDNGINKDKKNLILLLPMIIATSLIKNSSLFFVLIVSLYMFRKYWNSNKVIGILPFSTMVIAQKSWSYHVKRNFSDLGKHNMDLSSYKDGFLDKDKTDILRISKRFLQAISDERVALVLALIIIIFYFIYNKDTIYKNVFLFVVLVYTCYQLGNYLMYILSMPIDEALNLAGYGRYVKTIRAYLILVSFYRMPFDRSKIIPIIMAIFMIYLSINPIKNAFRKDNNREIYLENKEKLQEFRVDGKNKKILVEMDERDKSSYYYFMARYLYDTNDVRITYPEDDNNYNINDFDYYIDISSK